ncbi:MAG TPA: hypothetical protein VGF82_25345 [Terracidiphilus sp.]
MRTRVLSFVLLAGWLAAFSPDARAQVSPAGQGAMLRPPPVSDGPSSNQVGAEEKSNYLRLGVQFRVAYIDNLFAGSSTGTISETTYSIYPTIAFDTATYRHQLTVSYNPGFTFYHPTSALNEVDQNATVNYLFRVTPHVSIDANDRFLKTSSSYGSSSSSFSVGSNASSGAPQVIITPYAAFLTNGANGSLSWQFRPTGMIGFSGSSFILRYPNQTLVPGLYESDQVGGGFFYSHRITGTQYIGADYRYGRTVASPQGAEFETQTHTIYFFYTIYPKEHLSISVSGGPQYYQANQTSSTSSGLTGQQGTLGQTFIPSSSAWTPAVVTSVAWQGLHTNLGGSYARTVTAGGGLLGTFASNSVSATGRWQMAPKWTSGVSAGYSTIKTVDPGLFSSTQGGHTLLGAVTLEHPIIRDRFITSFEYNHVHQNYNGIAVISANPDSNRFMGTISWQFARPLGR